MIYVVIALAIGLATSIYINYLTLKDVVSARLEEPGKVIYSQSDYIEQQKEYDSSTRETQGDNQSEDDGTQTVNVAMYDGQAYWIDEEDGLMTAPLDENEEVERTLQKNVDAYTLSDSEIELIMTILDKLKEVEDDSSGTG